MAQRTLCCCLVAMRTSGYLCIMSRSTQLGTVVQAELLEKTRELLDKRGRGERLEVFNHEKFPRFLDIVQYFSNEVRGARAARQLAQSAGGHTHAAACMIIIIRSAGPLRAWLTGIAGSCMP